MSEIKLPYIIAVDFDGTLFEDAWPLIGDPIMENVLRLKKEVAGWLIKI